MRRQHVTLLLAAIFCGLFCVGTGETMTPPASVVPPSFFGMHIHRAASTTPWPSVPFGAWRLWDANVAWPNLEPQAGVWHFENLDKLVALAEKNNVEVLLPLALSPSWASARPTEKSIYAPGYAAEPRNIEDWRNYVRTVATRYKGRIHCYEIWNEPNLKDFYTGNPQQMGSLAREAYAILKEIDPSIVVVSPSATGDGNGRDWLDEYLSKGGGKYADVIGYHFYVTPDAPESMASFIDRVKSIAAEHGAAGKPLWNTETGWFIANRNTVVKASPFGSKSRVLTEEVAAAYIARAHIISWASGVQRFYWYAWDNKEMGLTEADGKTVKSPAIAYKQLHDWLLGARMTSFSSDGAGPWITGIIRDGGYAGWIVWNPYRKMRFNVPKEWGINRYRDLKGDVVIPGSAVYVGPQPLLLEHLPRGGSTVRYGRQQQ